jgi:signal transduction protein with GAF and PtsI domain
MDAEQTGGGRRGEDGGPDDARFAAELRAALTLAGATETLATPSPPDRLLELIVQTAARAVPAPEGALFLIDPERRVLTFDVVIGPSGDRVKDLEVPLGKGIAGLVAASGQPLAIANAQQDPRHARDIAEQAGYFPDTILAVPVTAPDGTPIGVLELLDRQGQPTFDLADMELLSVFAQQVALVLELRRAHASLGALVGRALGSLGGLPPEMERHVAERTAAFAAAVAADPAARRTQELAELVVAISRRGPTVQRACVGVLDVFAEYLRATPEPGLPGFGLGTMR